MRHEEFNRKLDDYLDGTLGEGERQEVEEHLEECQVCRAELEKVRDLVAAAGDLPRVVEPPRDLWPHIDREIDGLPLRHRTLWSARYLLAAAAIALVLISSAITAALLGGGSGPASGPAFESTALLVEWGAAEAEYGRAIDLLAADLESRREELDPETLEIVERNLRIIDTAIAEAREALLADPANRELLNTLASIYQTKLRVLRQASSMETRL